jgi:hypothetical protein
MGKHEACMGGMIYIYIYKFQMRDLMGRGNVNVEWQSNIKMSISELE